MDIGAQLRACREAHGLSLDTLAQKTRVQPRILAAIERNEIRALPPKPYARGFVRAYAKEIGRDPEALVREYFAQFAPATNEPPGPPAPSAELRLPQAWVWLAGTCLSVLLLVLWSVGSSPTEDRAQPAAVGTSGMETPAPRALATEPQVVPAGASRSAPATVSVLLTATRDCWVTATADGERAIFRLLRAGNRETLRGDREVVIRAGDAGALSLTINGRDIGPFGAPGEVRTLRITPASAPSIR